MYKRQVLYTCEALEKEGYRVTYLNVDKEGRVDLEQLKAELSEDTALVSVCLLYTSRCV